VVLIARRIAPWRHKAMFDYILLNNHHLSTLLYPTLQTRIYGCVTVLLYLLAMGTALLFDFGNLALTDVAPGIRCMIFLFHTINLRFCGFQTFDISTFTTGTLLVYVLLMATKPQMLCALDESPFEIYWLTLETQAAIDHRSSLMTCQPTSTNTRPTPTSMTSVAKTKLLLRRQSIAIQELAKQALSNTHHVKRLRMRLFWIHFVRALINHMFQFFIQTRTWLFVFIFLICAFEYRRMAPVDPNITLLKIIFEIISAFGGVGMSLGYPDRVTSFCSVLSSSSKIILIATMLMGRHRGLLASMKDQEVIEYSASEMLKRRRQEFIRQYPSSKLTQHMTEKDSVESIVSYF
jgi:hypothetical protein